ncbi:MAG: GNAT family N-acetyltransferase [Fimbriimonadaceae bacterium]|jgi:GNAT superfamily N-acetyltransferase|nr:GNAT family N-acetyltransferase [Fimbriimonadaceae bacterium]
MREIRPIHEHESETFLRLLCDCFELDMSRAQGVFFTEPFFDLRRKWALFEDGVMHSILTTTPLEFGWGKAIGIAGVATAREFRKKGLGQALLEEVLLSAAADGEGAALLFAHETVVYERVGFDVIDEVVQAEIVRDESCGEVRLLDFPTVQKLYTEWASDSPDRLRRDNKRWTYWQWVPRPCEGLEGGYLCQEGLMVREAVISPDRSGWPVPPGSQFFGLRSMAQKMGVPLRGTQRRELLLMAYRFPSLPEMFMTDQF